MRLSSIVPWGRNFTEYRGMFALTDADLQGRVLGCGDGPASFNAEASASGLRVVSVDPIYAFTGAEIEARVAATFEAIMSQVRARASDYVWDMFADPDALARVRLAAMRRFLADFEEGKQAGRYVVGSLPQLPFPDASFDLALCSHLLFLYSEQMSLADHIAAARKLLRVAGEVRIFPLVDLVGQRSPHVAAVCEALQHDGCVVEERRVAYEFKRGGNAMLRLRAR